MAAQSAVAVAVKRAGCGLKRRLANAAAFGCQGPGQLCEPFIEANTFRKGRASVRASPDFRTLPAIFGLASTLALPSPAR